VLDGQAVYFHMGGGNQTIREDNALLIGEAQHLL
jgi:hypothetical protein